MLVREIYNATQGNPLFIDEILKNLQRDGVLYINDSGRWHIEHNDGDYSHIQIPSSIRDVSSEQAGRLNAAQKRLMETLSVFTASVSIAELAACSGMDEAEASAVADECAALGYVSRTNYRGGLRYSKRL